MIDLVEGTYDEDPIKHLSNQVLGYLDIFQFEEHNKDAFYALVMASVYGDPMIERLQCVKQFLRLTHLVNNKLWYVDGGPNIGQLYPNGTFVKNDTLLDIIFKFGSHQVMSDEDMEYVVELYKDRSYVVGYMPVPETRKKPEPLEHTDGESDFA